MVRFLVSLLFNFDSFNWCIVSNVLTKLQALQKLSETDRSQVLQPLQDAGWSLVENRDAIYKEFQFKDFNQVFYYTYYLSNVSN